MILTIEINTTKDDPMLVDKALGRIYTIDGVEDVRLLDTGIEELEQENRLLRARNERLEGEAKQQPAEEPVAWMDEDETCIFFDKDRPNPMDYSFWKRLYRVPRPAAQFAGSYGTIDESAAKRIATALGWEPKREWVGLTDEEIGQTLGDAKVTELPNGYEMVDLEIARAIEAKLKEKNT